MTEDTPTPVLTADATARPDQVWPQVQAHRSGVYGFIDPAWGDHMIAMTMETWQDVIGDAKALHARLVQLEAEKAAALAARPDEKKIILVNPPKRIMQ
jgi:hypothetical protein